MITLIRTNSENTDFISLVRKLDADLAERDGADHSFYDQFNNIQGIRYAVVAYEDGRPVGCGAIKPYGGDAMEIKRMYVAPAARRRGVAASILAELETWARELSRSRCVLETGKRQPEAIALYKKRGYEIIPNYGQYVGVANSMCFGKGVGPGRETGK